MARSLEQDSNCTSGAGSEIYSPSVPCRCCCPWKSGPGRFSSVSFSRRTPPSHTALGPSRTGSHPREVSFSRFRTLPGFHSGKALQEEEGETQASCSWINDHNLLFKTNFEEATGHMDATEFRCAVGDTE